MRKVLQKKNGKLSREIANNYSKQWKIHLI